MSEDYFASLQASKAPKRSLQDCFAPLPGSQQFFMTSPVYETLYEGTRGPGKTITLLMDYAQHVNQGFGPAWRGVLFRRHYKDLDDAISKSKQWFPKIFGATFNEQKTFWRFPNGEELLLRQFATSDDYWSYHGHEYPWIGWEELTTYPDDGCYKVMMSCSRSSYPGMPRKYRATTNPYGRGHNWVKNRFRLPHGRGKIISTPGEPDRIAIHGRLTENTILLKADPHYINNLRAAARNHNELMAWTEGSWDITSGGMFDDVWDSAKHVIPPFRIPASWRIDRSLDWGSSRPFSIGWWAISDGSDVQLTNGRKLFTRPGDLFRIGEWYGWNGQPNTGLRVAAGVVAQGIRDREASAGMAGRVKPGPADSQIFAVDDNKRSVAKDMEAKGVTWLPADKGPGSRKQGWDVIRQMLTDSLVPAHARAGNALWVFDTCHQFLRTFPVIPRSDKDPDDVDTEAEDHVADEVRYRCRWSPTRVLSGNF